MHVLVGLGNPGRQYEGHRHNVGFMVLDAIAQRYGAAKWKERANALVTEVRIGGDKVVLVKPMSFMNKSGQPLRHVLDFWKLKAEAVTVFYDELDLPVAKIRVKRGGGAGGHNGIRSMDAHVGQNYRRVRIGIAHPGHKDKVAGYVLHDFSREDRARLDILIPGILDELPRLLGGDESGFTSMAQQGLQPDRNSEKRAAKTAASDTTQTKPAGKPAKIGGGPPTAMGAALSRLLNKNTDRNKD